MTVSHTNLFPCTYVMKHPSSKSFRKAWGHKTCVLSAQLTFPSCPLYSGSSYPHIRGHLPHRAARCCLDVRSIISAPGLCVALMPSFLFSSRWNPLRICFAKAFVPKSVLTTLFSTWLSCSNSWYLPMTCPSFISTHQHDA